MSNLKIKALMFGLVITTVLISLAASLVLSTAYPIIGVPILLVVLTLVFALTYYYAEKD